ncbi:YiiX/YebB-like N1pC/P60 family cysteine hydrolase [Pseudoduganella sp. LjRoot289]|uniref:YiiX/YebB-like N1pC/P60 family cysteine hydrolase n=1 Tax=Pseudoduganella sp. LjRoot289 TaxID=3342314 RepID=UPI003ECE7233
MSELIPKYSTPLAGDIILCGASWNVHVQRLLRPGSVADYSHAAVMCSINFGVQAMPDSGVDAFGLHEFFTKQLADSPWKIYRHRDLDTYAANQGAADIMMRFRDAAKYFMGQGYNFGINMPELPGSTDRSYRSFCSQLVARVYEKAEDVRPHSRLLTSTVLPSDLQSHFSGNNDWLEVTSIYSNRMDWVVKKQQLASEIATDSASIEILRDDLKLSLWFQEKCARDEAALPTFGANLASLEAQANRLYKRVTGIQLTPRPPLDMTSHLAQALKQGAQSNWRARNIFEGYQWRLRLRKIWLTFKSHRN